MPSYTIAYDALNPDRIPADALMVLGYDSWAPEQWDRFTRAQKIRIAQHPAQTGLQYSILDVERGDAAIEDAPGWIQAQQRIGAPYTTIYVDKSNLFLLREACHGLHYYILVAWWTVSGRPIHLPGTIGTQYEGNVLGGAYDLSAIYDPGWHPLLPAAA